MRLTSVCSPPRFECDEMLAGGTSMVEGVVIQTGRMTKNSVVPEVVRMI